MVEVLQFKKEKLESDKDDMYLDYINLRTLSRAVNFEDLHGIKNREPASVHRLTDWRVLNEQVCL